MRPPAPLLLCLLATATVAAPAHDDSHDLLPAAADDVLLLSDDTVISDGDSTAIEEDADHEPVVRKKRTFGDIVFRGLADVLGYSVARKPPQAAFPPPLGPVPGIDTPLQAATTPAPAPAPTAAPAPAQAAPCGSARAAGPPPCRAQKPPKPKAAAPCAKPKAAPRAKPKTPPPPPPPPPTKAAAPPPCGQPRANPATPAPCAPAPPPPKQQAENNLERVSSNFQLNFNFNRSPVNQAAAADAAPDADPQTEQEQEPEQQQAAPVAPVAIQPRAAKLPLAEPRNPRVYVDAFVVRNGVAQRVNTLDANRFDPQRGAAAADDDFLSYDEEGELPQEDDYEDAQESRDRSRAVQDFGVAVDRFWGQKKPNRRPRLESLPSDDYRNVHFGERDYDGQALLQSLQRELPALDAEEDAEATTTTEDPKRSLRPRVLPPTEHNPNQIDTVTVRVPPIYKEKRPRKLHDAEDTEGTDDFAGEHPQEQYIEGEESWDEPATERPKRRKRRRKQHRTARSVDESELYSAGEFDYFGKKLPISDEEKFYMQLTIPPPTKDPDLARHEATEQDHFLDDHERLRDEKERIRDDKKIKDDDDRPADDDSERLRDADETELVDDKGRIEENERSDGLSPNAQVRETGYQNNYVHATNVKIEDDSPVASTSPAPPPPPRARPSGKP